MVFSSLEFLFLYLPLTLLLYYIIPSKHLKWRNLVLLIMSLIFYGWGEPVYAFLMIFTVYSFVYMTKNCYSAAMASIVAEGVMTKTETGVIAAFEQHPKQSRSPAVE